MSAIKKLLFNHSIINNLFNNIVGQMLHRTSHYSTYQDAVNKLNRLQIMPKILTKAQEIRQTRLDKTISMCGLLGITLDDIDRLKVIHVAGTKGKGSTCAFSESILRHSGFKTGLFSSPHLIEVRERLKINGQSLTHEKFTEYFDYCNKILIEDQVFKDELEMPIYFQFLTCMMFYVFVKENIDVAIVEVGLGGFYDCTNVIRNPIVCGITSLGLDHCSILGNTIEEIAWQKAGIFKTGSIAFTVNSHSESTLNVLKKRALETGISLCISKPLDSSIKLGLEGEIQYQNSSLAVNLANYWIQRKNGISLNDWLSIQEYLNDNLFQLKPVTINQEYYEGLKSCRWPGRNQMINSKNPKIKYYIDGAHTVESVQQFIDWFNKINCSNNKNVLLFNYTGDRNGTEFLKFLLKQIKLSAVAFSNLEAFPENDCNTNSADTKKLNSLASNNSDLLLSSFKNILNDLDNVVTPDCRSFNNIKDALIWLTKNQEPLFTNSNKFESDESQVNVLITGSLYLIGLSLKVLNMYVD